MSSRELKSLVRDQQNLPAVRTRLRSGKAAAMSDESSEEATPLDSQVLELQQKLSMAQEELETVRAGADKQIQEARETVEKATQEAIEAKQVAEEWQTRVAELEQELERADQYADGVAHERKQMQLEAELERLRQLEDVRQQFNRERERHRLERERDTATIEKLKKELELERKKLAVAATATKESKSAGGTDAAATTTEPKKSSESVSKHDSTSKDDSSSEAGKKVTFGEPVAVGSPRSGVSVVHDGLVDSDGNESGGGQSVVISGATDNTGGAGMRSPDSGERPDSQKSDLSGENHSLVQSLAQLVKTQNQMVEAHTRAMSAQGLPPLKHFSGEGVQSCEDGFDRFIEQFEELASIAGWSEEHCRYRLKMHLSKTAFQTYRLLPESVKANYSETVEALRKRFKPVDIEELRGIEFHQMVQGSRSVEELGLELQRVAKRAFPALVGRDLDRLLKGRYFQALDPRWQRKLGAPKPEESFDELFNRARVAERREQQYKEVEGERNEKEKVTAPEKQDKTTPKAKESSKSKTGDSGASHEQGGSSQGRSIQCNSCHGYGHIAKYCRHRFKKSSEAPGRSKGSNTPKALATTAELSDEQLEEELAKRRLGKEREILGSTGSVQTVTGKAIGPTMVVDVEVEGVLVSAVVDTGSQSTIISRPFLHRVKRHLESKGKAMPELQLPGTTFYGKSGVPLEITARVSLSISVDGKTVKVPVFIQPHSEQDCLLGSNVLGPLGVTVRRASGETIGTTPQPPQEPEVATVKLVQTVRVPRKTGVFVEAEVEGPCREGEALVFEQVNSLREDHCLISHDSLVTVRPGNKIFVPLHNKEAFSCSVEKNVKVGTAVALNEKLIGEVEISQCNKVQNEANTGSGNGRPRIEQLLAMLNFSKDELSLVEYEKIKKFLYSNMDVFALDDTELGCTSLVQHEIDTGDYPPMKQHFRRVPFVHREKISQMIDDMLEKGIIQPSCSPWASPIVLVPKKDGQLRFCVDYRKLNSVTKKDQYPLPRIEDILDTLAGMRYFSTLDLASGYWQIEMGEEARQKSAFVTHRGLHEFVRMPFGLCNAPATFQRLMEVVLDDMLWKVCFVYIDDVLVCSKTLEEHLVHLTEVFARLRKANLHLKPKKCMFLRPKVQYLGHVISLEGVSPDPEKVDKVKNYPVPTNPTEVRQFLGLASYYRRFMKDFARIAKPLYLLTCKDMKFEWSSTCHDAFEALKSLLVTAPVLAYPRFGEGVEFVVETDASTSGLGAVLSQKQEDGRLHPIAYASRKLQPAEVNYGITELETLGIVWAVKYFRSYLLGHKVILYSDHAACTSLLNCSNPSPKLARWAMIVQEMDLTIKHRPGRSNSNADTLSRLPSATSEPESLSSNENILPTCLSSCKVAHCVNGYGIPCEVQSRDRHEHTASAERGSISCLTHVCSVSVPAGDNLDDRLRKLQIDDSELGSMIKYLEENELPTDQKLAKRIVAESPQFTVLEGVLHFDSSDSSGNARIAVPECLKETVLKEAHGGCFAGHFAERRTLELLKRRYWWKTMRSDVRRHCRSCLVCASREGPGRPLHPNLQPIPVGGPFNRVGVDVLQLPPTYNGNRYAVVFSDYLTKWPEVFPSPDQKAETIARLLVEQIVPRHGVPEQLLSDRGQNFLSELVLEVCKLLGTKKINTTGYHPQTDGLVERLNRTLITMLSKCVEKHGRDWDERLPYVLFAYRVSVHDSTKESPFYLMYGRDAKLPTETALSQPTTPYQVDIQDYRTELVTHLSDAWTLAQDNIAKAQVKQKRNYDRSGMEPKLQKGDRVMVRMPGEIKGKSWKFVRPYHGPFRVVSVTPTNAEVVLVDKPDDDPIFVSLKRVRPCYEELPDVSWTGHSGAKSRKKKSQSQDSQKPEEKDKEAEYNGPITRSMARNKKGKFEGKL